MRWSVGIEAEGDRVLTLEQVVELADAVAASGGIATGIATTAPSTITDSAMAISTCGSTRPAMPAAPAAAITDTKLSGTSHSARPPRCAASRPTATMAML